MSVGDARFPGLGFNLSSAATPVNVALISPGQESCHQCPFLGTSLQHQKASFICAHFTNEETEAQRGELTFPRPYK